MKLPCHFCAAGWARYVLTWQMHLTDSKVRPSGSPGRDTSLVDLMTCPFPEHSSNCKFVGEICCNNTPCYYRGPAEPRLVSVMVSELVCQSFCKGCTSKSHQHCSGVQKRCLCDRFAAFGQSALCTARRCRCCLYANNSAWRCSIGFSASHTAFCCSVHEPNQAHSSQQGGCSALPHQHLPDIHQGRSTPKHSGIFPARLHSCHTWDHDADWHAQVW